MQHRAIFDIGKTNKKFFVFDENFQEVFKDYACFETIPDEDGFPADDLGAIENWMKTIFHKVLNSEKYNIQSINFSTYGASLVHLDEHGIPLTPLYNYLKPYPESILQDFYKKYGNEWRIAQQTASPPSGMLNAGFQLYWLKYARPDIFKKVKWSLHFPQYLSFLFAGIPLSEPTSIGCHTSLWDFEKKDYHYWVYQEKLNRILPPIVATDTAVLMNYEGKKIKIGVGIHDSSAALLPYLLTSKKPFLLLSTGTWSIALNPFVQGLLSKEDLQNDTLNYSRIDGQAVKAVRLFLGNEYQIQVNHLSRFFEKEKEHHKHVVFEKTTFSKIENQKKRQFHLESIGLDDQNPERTDWSFFKNYEEAYHLMMLELMTLQSEVVKRAIGSIAIKKIYIDGGFSDNDLFVKILLRIFPQYKIRTTHAPMGSALGAAMIISDKKIGRKFLKKNYALRKYKPS